MADWENVQPDVYALIDCDYTPGRDGSIQAITLHHNAGNLSIQDCHDLWERSETSAHYQVQSDGTIGQLVNDSDTAWACGNWWANSNTISIEHANDSSDPWTVWPAAVDSGAHLVAALCRYYDLGEPEWMSNVFPHSHWSSTACPGELAGSQNEDYMARAKWYYSNINGDYDAEHGSDDGGAEEAADDGDRPDAWPVQLYTPNGTDAQRWAVTWDGAACTLTCQADGRALDVDDGNIVEGNPVQAYTPNGTDAQKWKVLQASGDYVPGYAAPVELAPASDTSLRLDCIDGGIEDGTGLQLYRSNGTAAQQWAILDHGDGTWTLINVGSCKALDVVGAGA